MALDALTADNSKLWPSENRAAAIEALRAALAAPTAKVCMTCRKAPAVKRVLTETGRRIWKCKLCAKRTRESWLRQ